MDYRCSLRVKSTAQDLILGPNDQNNILYPLRRRGRVLFPYTPTIQVSSSAEYGTYDLVHTNYAYPAYKKSNVSEITVMAPFTAHNEEEASYLLSVIHFFRTVTKSQFGFRAGDAGGTPPPILYFSYMGDYAFNDVPVVVENFSMELTDGVDFVEVEEWKSGVPIQTTISLTLRVFYTPRKVKDEFSLDDFRVGKLKGKGFI